MQSSVAAVSDPDLPNQISFNRKEQNNLMFTIMKNNEEEKNGFISAFGRIFHHNEPQQETMPEILSPDEIEVESLLKELDDESQTLDIEHKLEIPIPDDSLIDDGNLIFFNKDEYNRLLTFLFSVDFKRSYQVTDNGLTIDGSKLKNLAEYLRTCFQYKSRDSVCFLRNEDFEYTYLNAKCLMTSADIRFVNDYFSNISCHEVTDDSIREYLEVNYDRVFICEELLDMLFFSNGYKTISESSYSEMMMNYRILPAVLSSDGEFPYLNKRQFVLKSGCSGVLFGLRNYDLREICDKFFHGKDMASTLRSCHYFCYAIGMEDPFLDSIRQLDDHTIQNDADNHLEKSPSSVRENEGKDVQDFSEFAERINTYSNSVLEKFSEQIDEIMGEWLKVLEKKSPSNICRYGKNIREEVESRDSMVSKLYENGLLSRSYCTAYQFEQFLRANPKARGMVVCADTIQYRVRHYKAEKVPESVRMYLPFFPPSCFPLRKYRDVEGEYYFMDELVRICGCKASYSEILGMI